MPKTKSLIAEIDALDAEPWSMEVFNKKRTLLLRAFQSSARDEMERAIRDVSAMRHREVKIRAVLLDEQDPLSQPLPKNPWGIKKDASLVDAIDHVWDLFEAPKLTKALLERVMALVLLEYDGKPALGYVHIHERDRYQVPEEFARKRRPPFDRRNALAWEPFGDLTMFIGLAPSKATKRKDGKPIPEPLRDFYRVHGGLVDGMWHLTTPDQLATWDRMLEHKKNVSPDEDDPIRADELLSFFGYGDDRSDLIDLRDPEDPVVLAWGDGQLYSAVGEPFIEWLEDKASLFLHIAE